MKKSVFAACLFAFGGAGVFAEDALKDGFRNPPVETRPMTWMHMMNSNGSKEGLSNDLRALSEAGVGGAIIFSVAKPEIANGPQKFN